MMKKNTITAVVVFLVVLILLIGACLLVKNKFKGTANLTWQPNKESNLAGYKIYYGVSPRTGNCPQGGYEKLIETGTTSSYIISGLEDNKTYYFSITSFNIANKESCFSAEVSKHIKLSLKDKFRQAVKLINF